MLPDVDTTAQLSVDFETLNYAAIVKADASGKILSKNLTTSEKRIETLEAAEYTGEEQIAFKQAVKRPIVKTLAGFDELYSDDAAKLYIINQGISKFADAKVRAVLLATNDADTEFEFVPTSDTPYDLTEDLKQIPTRGKKQSDLDVVLKSLGKIKENPELFAQFKAVFNSMQK